ARLMAGVRAEARARQRLVAQILGGTPASAHMSRQGVHLWHPLPSYWTATEFAASAWREGLAVTPAEAFRAGATEGNDTINAIRISLGEGADRARLGRALKRLSDLLAQPPRRETGLVV